MLATHASRRHIINRVMISAIAFSMAATAGVAAAQHDEHRGDSHHERSRHVGSHHEHSHHVGSHHEYSHHYDHGRSHRWQARSDWRRGGHIGSYDWRRGRVIDYRVHHLRRPPRGYAWREVDGRYVLAAIASGVIADLILSGH